MCVLVRHSNAPNKRDCYRHKLRKKNARYLAVTYILVGDFPDLAGVVLHMHPTHVAP